MADTEGARLVKPIIVVGAARSGTSLVAGQLLKQHQDVAYWTEPVHIWRFGHAYRSHDVLSAQDVTPRIREFIRKSFTDFLEKSGKRRFMEKTPSNCFRLPFISEIFPDAKFIHIVRDGRAVALSAAVEWRGGRALNASAEKPRLSAGLRSTWRDIRFVVSKTHRWREGVTHLREAPAELPRLVRLVKRKLHTSSQPVWGPRFPGIEGVARAYSLLEACAIQWDWSVRAVVSFGRSLPPSQYLEVRYEELLSAPSKVVGEMLAFLELEEDPTTAAKIAQAVRSEGLNQWAEAYEASDLQKVMAHIEPTLQSLGYQP